MYPALNWLPCIDTSRFEPPAESKPEAANFPTQTYAFSESHSLFKAPRAYPEAPKDMWYQVPENKPAHEPNPIFPWEQAPDRPRPTRVFAEDLSPEPTPTVMSPTHAFSTVHYSGDDKTAAGRAKDPSPERSSYQQHNVNAWDNVPGIDNYVRAISDLSGQRSKSTSLQKTTGTDDIGSPSLERRNRRESLIITDFPSAVERPSLPVTPAPVRRPMFWGEDKSKTGELPSAPGVPDQTEWVC
jgi:glycogenin glucosyltransferase